MPVDSGPPRHDTSPSKPCGIVRRCGWMWQAICVGPLTNSRVFQEKMFVPSASKSRCSANPASTSTIRTRNTPSVPSPATQRYPPVCHHVRRLQTLRTAQGRRNRLFKGMGDSDGDAWVESKSNDRPLRPTPGPSATRPRPHLLPPRPPGGTPFSRRSRYTDASKVEARAMQAALRRPEGLVCAYLGR